MQLMNEAWLFGQAPFDPGNLMRVPGTHFDGTFSTAMLGAIVLGATAYWLLQRGVVKSKSMAIAGYVVFGIAAMLGLAYVPANMEDVILYCFSLLAIAGGLAFIVAREPVHAALGFATAVLSACGVLFMQQAYFVAAATIIVYAGATIIIFLFVLMFAQQTHLKPYDVLLTRPALAAIIGTALVITITWSVAEEGEILPLKIDVSRPNSLAGQPALGGGDPPVPILGAVSSESPMSPEEAARFVPSKTAGLGRAMYTDYLMAVELAGTVLLVATVGAIVLAQKQGRNPT